ncbi:hypothetical protein L9F63_015168, partial [Diploptera punctata]
MQADSSTDCCQSSSNELPPSMFIAERHLRNVIEMISEANNDHDSDTSAKEIETSYPQRETSTLLSSVLSSIADITSINDVERDGHSKKADMEEKENFNPKVVTINLGEQMTRSTQNDNVNVQRLRNSHICHCKVGTVSQDKTEEICQDKNDGSPVNRENENNYCIFQENRDQRGEEPLEIKHDMHFLNLCGKNEKKVRICQCEQEENTIDNLLHRKIVTQMEEKRKENFSHAESVPKVNEKTDKRDDPCMAATGITNTPVPSQVQPPASYEPTCSCPLHGYYENNAQMLCDEN